MALAKRQSAVGPPTILLIAPNRLAGAVLDRAVAISAACDAELEVCCPVVSPPAPHSAAIPGMPPTRYDDGAVREEARRLAAALMASLSERGIDAHIETGICRNMTDGVLDAARRLDPDLVILPREEDPGPFDQIFSFRPGEISSDIDVPVWLLHPGSVPGRSVVGLIDFDPEPRDAGEANERIAGTAVRIGKRLRTETHLLCCARQPLALGTGAAAPERKLKSLSERKESRMLGRLHELADGYGIDSGRVHLHHGDERDVLEQLAMPLNLGLVVTNGEPRGVLSRILRRPRELKLAGVPSDLLVVGEKHVACT